MWCMLYGRHSASSDVTVIYSHRHYASTGIGVRLCDCDRQQSMCHAYIQVAHRYQVVATQIPSLLSQWVAEMDYRKIDTEHEGIASARVEMLPHLQQA